jgi:eukaryotic-like serine/threonine-protein kinase
LQFTIGQHVGPYKILAPLGAGGMGEVYRARDAKLERDVALKILPAELANNTEALRRFELEARAASALNHPNIVTIYEISRENDIAWIAMELVDGEDLRTLIQRDGLTIKGALRIASKIAEGLAAAHERGIAHRDLKPENVMISRDGFVKILDFGLAKQRRVLASDDTTLPHTAPGAVFGTVGYMSPEQAKGLEMDYRSDQFSFGVMLYEMLTRKNPFQRDSKPETMTAIIRDEVEPPSALDPSIPREIDRIVARCIAKQQRDRYGSTRDLAHDLREVRDSATQPSYRSNRPLPLPKRRTMPMVAALVAVVVIAGIAVGVRMWNRSRDAAGITSIAVVPFRDLSGTAEGRVLADGLSEMIATRLADVRELRIAPPFDGAPITEEDARKMRVHAIIRGTVQRAGGDVRVTYSLVNKKGDAIATSSETRAATEIFALEDAVADDLLAVLGRAAPKRVQQASAMLRPDDQKRFVEAVGLLQRVRDEKSVDQAIATLESVLANARESGAVNALLARALLYKASLSRRPAFIEQATVYAMRGVALSGDDAEAHVTLGELQNASGRHAEAEASFKRALQLSPNHAEATASLAQAYEGLGRAADAEATYKRAITLRPDSPGTSIKYGAFCYQRGRYNDAVSFFEHATRVAPSLAIAWSNYGAALHAADRRQEALTAFEKSLALQPSVPGFTNLGNLQFSLGRYDDAVGSFERAATMSPTEFITWQNLGDARRWSTQRRGEAVDAYRRAVEAGRAMLAVNPHDANARASVALCLAHSGAFDDALTEIRRALEVDPTHAYVLYKASRIAVLRGNHDSAISWIERAIKAGYPASELDRDPELTQIRDLPAFRNAIESAKRKPSA